MDNTLQHHGVLGQKWGVRRFQNRDGTLTAAGKKRYDKDVKQQVKNVSDTEKAHVNGKTENPKTRNPFKKHKNKLINKYIEQGYSAEAAETIAKGRMRTEVIVAALATATVAVVGTKAVTRIGQDYCDKVIKSGQIIQNIGADGSNDFKNRPFFAAINKHDKKAYGNLYPREKRGMELRERKPAIIYNNQIRLNKDVKRASVDNARKIFSKMMKEDPEFSKEVLSAITETSYGDSFFKAKGSKKYNHFNQALATPAFQKKGIHKKFYSELEKQGYNAILDINDTRYSGYKDISKSPTIFFGDKWDKIASVKLSDVEISKNAEKYIHKNYLPKKVAKIYGRDAAIIGVGVSIYRQQKVNNYLKEHPDSKLSRKEILDKIENDDKLVKRYLKEHPKSKLSYSEVLRIVRT